MFHCEVTCTPMLQCLLLWWKQRDFQARSYFFGFESSYVEERVCLKAPLYPRYRIKKIFDLSLYQLCLLHIHRPLTFITEAPPRSLMYMADKTSHQAGSVCTGPAAALHEQTRKPVFVSLQPQGHRRLWKWLMFPLCLSQEKQCRGTWCQVMDPCEIFFSPRASIQDASTFNKAKQLNSRCKNSTGVPVKYLNPSKEENQLWHSPADHIYILPAGWIPCYSQEWGIPMQSCL